MKILAAILLLLFAQTAFCQDVHKIVVSVPGPRNLSYLPIDLIPKIAADRDAGVKIQLLHTGGGSVALNNLVTRNADFAVAGLPAAMSLRANNGDVFAVAAVDDAPLFVLMVRSALKDKVKRIADLKGKVIGVNTSTKNSKTTSQQLAELVLQSDGVDLDSVRIVPAGQSWVEQSSLMITGAADAVMGDEPFASRLLAKGQVFFLANLAEPETARKIPGANFLHAAVLTRADVMQDSPDKVEKMVGMLRKSLQWIATHSPEEVVDKLGVTDPDERASLLLALNKYPRAFSKDGMFSTRQLRETELFFRKTSAGDPRGQALVLDSMVNAKWAGRRK
ncbi:ABC transporter substrate-binding protein [Sulfurimicrobium lacus]|uniref:ABC transporter substrate-binding protein n=1 Tax=Sulfurimicrobium lacus TaxID=2715678 RepID=A0A6F8V806_9PROT|nr:ABC transporter substrate-binding protein [Sulfurimicrobium lacus]BCB25973.1 ABC transporter substrate-binding protein [Sulfurimicrobium lacus]